MLDVKIIAFGFLPVKEQFSRQILVIFAVIYYDRDNVSRKYMTKLLLVRHGYSEANKEDLFAGFFDTPLDERGIPQAQITAQYIKNNYDVKHVYASDLKRAYRTGETIAVCFGVGITEKNLREIFGGEWEGKKFVTLKDLYPEDFPERMTDSAKAHCTGGETVAELAERTMRAIKEIVLHHEG